ncbi:hypothetical protein MCUN1_002803 [Malassezia cuniculi]|uniref:Uncharacterized protein n=1 Tax=Malassezia cuniculi TaxID=948313 RepID=A0AAF0F0A6_9BASI|nr:hypothetical protein MCUN1_002803 [Malassezia cuniculi]
MLGSVQDALERALAAGKSGAATQRDVLEAEELLEDAYGRNSAAGDDNVADVRNAYAVLFATLYEPQLIPGVCILLCLLTRRPQIRASRLRRLLELRRKYPHDGDIYALLDTYAAFIPDTLVPDRRGGPPMDDGVRRRVLANWASDHALIVPNTQGRLRQVNVHGRRSTSLALQTVQITYLCGTGQTDSSLAAVNDVYGACLAASLGHVLAAAFLRHQTESGTVDDVPLFDPRTCGALDQAASLCECIGEAPPTIFRFLTHVVQSMSVRAVQCLTDGEPMSIWEAAWRPSVAAFARMVAILRRCEWTDVYQRILRPFVYLATLDGVSDSLSAMILRSLTRLYRFWRASGPINELRSIIIELEQAVLVDGVPSLTLCDAACTFHQVLGQLGDQDTTKDTYPLPFYLLVSPIGLSGSLVTLARVCEMVLHVRPVGADVMIVALVELLWSGRAFGVLQQQGLVVDGKVACDGSTFAALRSAIDGAVPVGLIASLSHGALLAPLFERFVNEILLAPANTRGIFVRAPITPSALKPARHSGLPPHMQYADVRIAFLTWLSKRSAPQILQLLQTSLPSLRGS